MALTKKQRAELRMKFGGRCAYCGCELPEKGWHADHVEAVRRNISKDYAMDRHHWGSTVEQYVEQFRVALKAIAAPAVQAEQEPK